LPVLLLVAQWQQKNLNGYGTETSIENKSWVNPIISRSDIIPDSVMERIIERGEVRYSDFGTAGDGKKDDADAIVAAHAFATQHELPVKADEGAKYYIGGKDRTAIICTDTDFGDAEFIIDDTSTEN